MQSPCSLRTCHVPKTTVRKPRAPQPQRGCSAGAGGVRGGHRCGCGCSKWLIIKHARPPAHPLALPAKGTNPGQVPQGIISDWRGLTKASRGRRKGKPAFPTPPPGLLPQSPSVAAAARLPAHTCLGAGAEAGAPSLRASSPAFPATPGALVLRAQPAVGRPAGSYTLQ